MDHRTRSDNGCKGGSVELPPFLYIHIFAAAAPECIFRQPNLRGQLEADDGVWYIFIIGSCRGENGTKWGAGGWKEGH